MARLVAQLSTTARVAGCHNENDEIHLSKLFLVTYYR
jgi:hypothetical protein